MRKSVSNIYTTGPREAETRSQEGQQKEEGWRLSTEENSSLQ
jgi:hypothetical protein